MRYAAVFLGLMLLLTSCGKQQQAFVPTPRGTSDPTADAVAWVSREPTSRFFLPVAPTHSMEPVINEHSLVLCQRYRGQILSTGACIVFNRGDFSRVLHVLVDQTATHVYVSGFANSRSDGWFPKTSIEGFVVGQLYLP